MKDRYGRTIDYVRISVTDRCNLRCVYCMPEEGVSSISHDEILRFDEIERICGVFAGLGVRKIKLTGGEPLVRRGLPELAAALKRIPGIESLTLTTNGVWLAEYYDALADAGVDAVTVSLDTLDPVVYQRLTRRNELAAVRRGLETAFQKGRMQVKINCVPVLGIEEQKLLEIAALAKDHDVPIRFIEMMPIGMGARFPFIKEETLRAELEAAFGTFTRCDDVPGNGPCHYFAVPDFKGRIGFISAVSHKFCSECNRIRLTSEGFLKSCLQYDNGVELKPILRGGSSEEELRRAVERAIWEKPKGHSFEKTADFADREHRGMSQIGG